MISGALEDELPIRHRVKTLAGQLPIEQIGLLTFVTVRLDHHIRVALADARDLAECLEQIGGAQIVQGSEREDEIEFACRIRQRCRTSSNEKRLDVLVRVLDGIREKKAAAGE